MDDVEPTCYVLDYKTTADWMNVSTKCTLISVPDVGPAAVEIMVLQEHYYKQDIRYNVHAHTPNN